jgi:hypothetical protein
MKKRIDPTTTFGNPNGFFTFDTKKPNERNIKGRINVVQEKRPIKKSLSLIRIRPRLAKEIMIRAAIEKKTI